MCRNIRTLHNFEPPATTEEVQASALQYVRKISGSTKPSQANAAAFERALAAGKPAIIHVKTDPEALTSRITLSKLREQALAKQH